MSKTGDLINRNCPVCGGSESLPFLSKLELHLVRCSNCAMIYVNPVPMEMATGAFYDAAGDEYLSPEKLASDYANVRFERELRIFRAHCPKGSVLDVGSSSGGFLYQLKKRFPDDYQLLGTDVSQAPLDHAAKMGVPILKGEFLSQTIEEKFDAVTFWAVMEHLSDPMSFLKKAAGVLKPGGHCFILTPNMNSLAIKLLGAKYRYIFSEHLNYFTAETIKKFAGSQFTVVGLKSTHFNPLVIAQDFRGGEREVPRAERIKLLKRTTGYKQSRMMLPIKMAYQATEAVLGRLFLADNVVVIGRKDSGF
ncbi:MAG TPA: class I SAM-dependent methyltransferase [Candidatus Acidoferrum sp.]|nr:class I SAM-dependent methyltransferase [Candidatus Acidoferrum sp.]